MNNLAVLQFGTSAMVASDFVGLSGYRTLECEGQVPTEPYNCCFSRVFQASVCITTYTACPCHPCIQSLPTLHDNKVLLCDTLHSKGLVT